MEDIIDISSFDKMDYCGEYDFSVITILFFERQEKIKYVEEKILGIEKDIAKSIINIYYNDLFNYKLPHYFRAKQKIKKRLTDRFIYDDTKVYDPFSQVIRNKKKDD